MTELASSGVEGEPQRPRGGFIAVCTSHWLAMIGLGLVLTAIVLWLCLLAVQLRHGEENPYVGVAMTIAGAVLVLGAIITPIGLYFGRKRLRTQVADGRIAWRRFLIFLVVTSAINLVIASRTGVQAVHALESKQFCGSCHVMTPESRAFDEGPHAALLCVDCHVGTGAGGFIKSKVQGTHQLISVLSDSVQKPIETAIESGKMVPSKETCEACHWNEKPAGARVKLIRRYGENEANTPENTLLTMNVGGELMGGIHGAHYGGGVEVRFVATDKNRHDIPLVEVIDSKTGKQRTYVKTGSNAAAFANQPRITMQCFDCHNRVAHVFQLPERAVDKAMMLGRMSPSLPFLKKTAVEILKKEYSSSEAAAAEIPAALTAYYEKSQPAVARNRADDIKEAAGVVADLYSRNVFPDLGVTWGTYSNNIGHQDSPGCFRCHDGDHATPSGESISKNCFICHFPSAVADTNPEVLKMLGVDRMLKKLEGK